MKNLIALIVVSLALGACASAKQINSVALGMTKAEVISAMGPPDHTKGMGREEFLVYSLYTDQETAECAGIGIITLGMLTKYCGTEYFVHLKDGRVFSYGKDGDYGISTKDLMRPSE